MNKFEIVPMVMLGLTLLILVIGVIFMALGNKFNKANSVKFMSSRVIMQALTIVAFAVLYYVQKKGLY